jgi:hypothetical protein
MLHYGFICMRVGVCHCEIHTEKEYQQKEILTQHVITLISELMITTMSS